MRCGLDDTYICGMQDVMCWAMFVYTEYNPWLFLAALAPNSSEAKCAICLIAAQSSSPSRAGPMRYHWHPARETAASHAEQQGMLMLAEHNRHIQYG